jgi:hypothetical protein
VSEGTIVVSTENGIYRTTNGSGTWSQQFSGGNLNLSRSPASSETIYGLSGTAIYQSPDNGATWFFEGSLPQCCASEIRADPVSASTAYVFETGGSSFGIYKTVNGGASWNAANTGLPSSAVIESVATGPDGSLYAGLAYSPGGSPGGVYKSTNQGATWAPVNSGLHTNFGVAPLSLVVAPSDASVVYVTDYFTLYESVNAGAGWSAVGPLPGGTNALAVSGTNSGTLYYATYYSTGQLFVSANSGGTWTPSSGLGVAAISRIVSDPLNAAGAYALAQTTHEAIVAKIDSGGQNLLYSTYLGDGSYGFGIATDGTGDAFVTGYVAGFPYNPEFPFTPGALQNNRNVSDGFVARISDATASCTYTVDPGQSLETWFSHFVQYAVTAPSGCPWTASSNDSWATIASGASGSGSGVVWVLANNTASTTQSATLMIAGQAVTLQQVTPNCGYNSFSPEASVVPGGGGSVQFNVLVGAACPWTITNNDPTAITIVSGASGTGNGSVTLNVGPNLGPNTRTFSVPSPQGDQETISQAGTTAPAVVSTLTSSPSGASITVTGSGCVPGTYTTPANLTWNANTNCTINFTTPQTIGGALYTFYSATVNGGPITSTNPLTVNSGTSPPTVNANFLAPCTYSLTPSSQSFGASGGLGSFTVNTASTCSWSPVPSANWITILPSGSKGTAKVNYAVASTTGGARAGTISAGGQQYNVSQAGFVCTYSIGPTFASPADTGGSVSVSVSAPAGCAWSAASNAPWLAVKSGAAGSGGGVVVLNVASNTGGPRSGSATIAGKTFTVTQGAGACGALDVTSEATVDLGGLTFVTNVGGLYYDQTLAVRNISGAPIPGPIYLVTLGEPTHNPVNFNTGLVSPPGLTTCFDPQGDYLVPLAGVPVGGFWLPGQVISAETLGGGLAWLIDAFAAGPSFTTKVLSGTPSQ